MDNIESMDQLSKELSPKPNKNRKLLKILFVSVVLIAFIFIIILVIYYLSKKGNNESHENNNNNNEDYEDDEDDSFIEKEQPELNEETKRLISIYHRDPNQDNYINLRNEVISNYNAVLIRKEKKLDELKQQTEGKPGGAEKVAEMEDIVQDIYITYWNRINSNMLRFTDSRLLKWQISKASQYEYIPVMGAGESIYTKRTPVTNSEYYKFIKENGYKAPSNWENGKFLNGEDDYPVNYVSYKDAQNYCNWLSSKDSSNKYRIASESEWELAAGHMPKDADFNNNIIDSRVSVNKYASVTRGAHGAIDFWGNVWEWTSTERTNANGIIMLGVKGGSWKSARTDCRTEHRKESRNENEYYDDVGFRVIQVLNGVEPELKVDLYTLDPPELSAKIISNKIELSWKPVIGAIEYQIFEYSEDTGLFKMLDKTTEFTYAINYSEKNKNCKYVVQSISYREISDNVSREYCIKPN